MIVFAMRKDEHCLHVDIRDAAYMFVLCTPVQTIFILIQLEYCQGLKVLFAYIIRAAPSQKNSMQ